MAHEDRHNLFIAYCWGGAGSTWLAWALNSHKHILCLHAPTFPRFNRHLRRDALAIVDAFYSLKALGSTYRCVGFTHGVRREWHPELVKQYGDSFRACILTRHPIKRINSLMALKLKMSTAQRLSLRERLARYRAYAKLAAAARRWDFPKDAASLGFYHTCYAVNRVVSEVATGLPIFRFEDLVGTVDKFQEFLGYVSNGTLTLNPDDIRDLQGTVKGKHAPKSLSVFETYAEWSELQKEAFRLLISPKALLAYEHLGYEFPEAARPAL